MSGNYSFKNRALSLVLAMVLCVTLLPVQAFAEGIAQEPPAPPAEEQAAAQLAVEQTLLGVQEGEEYLKPDYYKPQKKIEVQIKVTNPGKETVSQISLTNSLAKLAWEQPAAPEKKKAEAAVPAVQNPAAFELAAGASAEFVFAFTPESSDLAQNGVAKSMTNIVEVTGSQNGKMVRGVSREIKINMAFALTITANSSNFIHDGEDKAGTVQPDQFTAKGLRPTHTVTLESLAVDGVAADEGEYPIVPAGPAVTDAQGQVVTDQYEITLQNGTLTIGKGYRVEYTFAKGAPEGAELPQDDKNYKTGDKAVLAAEPETFVGTKGDSYIFEGWFIGDVKQQSGSELLIADTDIQVVGKWRTRAAVTVDVVWNDVNNEAKRPDKLELTLQRNEPPEPAGSAALTAANAAEPARWTHTWANLDVAPEGEAAAPYVYSVAPVEIANYTVVVNRIDENGKIVINCTLKEELPLAEVLQAPDSKVLKYNGQEQELVEPGKAEGGTMVYSLTKDGEYTQAVPKKEDASAEGYTVWYMVQGDEMHRSSAKASVPVPFAAASANEIKELLANGIKYGQKPQVTAQATYGTPEFTFSDALEGSYTAEIPDIVGTVYVKAAVAATTNYPEATASGQFTVSTADVSVEISLSSNTQKSGEKITVTAVVKNAADESTLRTGFISPVIAKLVLQGAADVQENRDITLSLKEGNTYEGSYTVPLTGEASLVFHADFTGLSDKYNIPQTQPVTLTVSETAAADIVIVQDEPADKFTYGDQAKFTLTAKNSGTQTAIAGSVIFYVDEVTEEKKLSSAKPLEYGSTFVTISTDIRNLFPADSHKIIAVVTPENSGQYAEATVEKQITVVQKELQWNDSGLTAAKEGEKTVISGDLNVTGILTNDDAALVAGQLATTENADCKTGGTVAVTRADEVDFALSGTAAGNYKLPTDLPRAKVQHQLEKIDAVKNTCSTDGHSTYWHCKNCEGYFTDLNADGIPEHQIQSPDEVKNPAYGHLLTEYPEKKPTCGVNGHRAYWQCEECGAKFLDAECRNKIETDSQYILQAPEHKLVEVAAKEVTCTENGNKAHWKCEECGRYYADSKGETELTESAVIITAQGHQMKKVEAAEATCTKKGNIEHWKCSVCGKMYADKAGTTELSEQEVVLTKDHEAGSEWRSDKTGHWHVCKICKQQVDKAKHDYGDWKTVKEATENARGSKERTCSVCGFTETEEIPIKQSVKPTPTPAPTATPAPTKKPATTAKPAKPSQPPQMEDEGGPAAVAKPAGSPAKVTAQLEGNLSETDSQTAQNITNALNAGLASQPVADPAVIGAAAEKAAAGNTITLAEGRNELARQLNPSRRQLNKTRIVMRHYLDVKLVQLEGSNSFTLDITPMLQTLATYADTNNEIRTEGKSANAVQLGELKTMPIAEAVSMSVPLPAGFVQNGEQLYVQHKDYVYDTELKNVNGTDYLLFQNPHGFSTFQILRRNTAEAKIGSMGYLTMEKAVQEVENGETITLLKEIHRMIPVDRETRFTLDGQRFSGDFEPADGLICLAQDKTYTITKGNMKPAATAVPDGEAAWKEADRSNDGIGWLIVIAVAALVVAAVCAGVIINRRKNRQASDSEPELPQIPMDQ